MKLEINETAPVRTQKMHDDTRTHIDNEDRSEVPSNASQDLLDDVTTRRIIADACNGDGAPLDERFSPSYFYLNSIMGYEGSHYTVAWARAMGRDQLRQYITLDNTHSV